VRRGLTYAQVSIYYPMPAASASLDPFTAIAEPRRRQLLGSLAGQERSVGDLVRDLGWAQPQVSKHLSVLRRTGLVRVRRAGRRSMYSVNAQQLKPVHDWVKAFERYWDVHLDRIKQLAERGTPRPAPGPAHPPKESSS
jgi:DNA-binding transcriptional ArsR family regulator